MGDPEHFSGETNQLGQSTWESNALILPDAPSIRSFILHGRYIETSASVVDRTPVRQVLGGINKSLLYLPTPSNIA